MNLKLTPTQVNDLSDILALALVGLDVESVSYDKNLQQINSFIKLFNKQESNTSRTAQESINAGLEFSKALGY